MTSLIFACDHRKNVQWDLPYIRLGNYQSDAAINIKDDDEIAPYQLLLSEGAQIWWIAKYLNELGNPDYIGFCHYRRFFSSLKPNYGVFPIHYEKYYSNDIKKYILNNQHLLSIATSNSVDCIIPIRFPDYSYCKNCNNVIDILYKQSCYSNLGLTFEDCLIIFQFLSNNLNGIDKTYLQLSTSHFNIFYMKSSLFYQMINKLYPIVLQCISYIKSKYNDNTLNSRWMAYVLERFISCYIMMLEINGSKILELPLLFIENMNIQI